LKEKLGEEGEIAERIQQTPPKVSRLAFGLPVGGSIEFADRLTLHTALEARIVGK